MLLISGGSAGERKALSLDPNEFILVFAANGIRGNIWKDMATLRAALASASARIEGKVRLRLLAIGESAPDERIGSAVVEFVPYLSEPVKVARYLRVADLYVHASRADTFPNTVLEALACGTPVVATSVGGIPEQVRSLDLPYTDADVATHDNSSATGCLTPAADGERMGAAIAFLAANRGMLRPLGDNARRDAVTRFTLDLQVTRYVDWYRSILERSR